MERQEPIITRELTADGWITTMDYGAQGVTRSVVHIARGTPEEAERNRAALNRVLQGYGYKLST